MRMHAALIRLNCMQTTSPLQFFSDIDLAHSTIGYMDPVGKGSQSEFQFSPLLHRRHSGRFSE
jgi:hypothetical protein